jgi:P-type Ca2+ transporter type 2C
MNSPPKPGTLSEGLSSADALALLAEHGPNSVERERTTSPITLLVGQFKSPVVWLLLGACALAALLG